MVDVRVLALGGCNLRNPLSRRLQPDVSTDPSRWSTTPAGFQFAGPPFFTYSLGEMNQALACYRGEASIPPSLMRLCNLRKTNAPDPLRSLLGGFDVALVEPNTSIEIVLDGIHINRRPIWQLLMPLRQLGPKAVRLIVRWFEKGIATVDADARREAAAELIPLIPADWPKARLTARVLRDAVSYNPPLREPLEDLVRQLDVPVGVVLFNWTYMPDGRALGWPAGFSAAVSDTAAALRLPIFDPADWVRRTGVVDALHKDFRHYTNAFLPTIAEALIAFMLSVAKGSQPGVQSLAEPSD